MLAGSKMYTIDADPAFIRGESMSSELAGVLGTSLGSSFDQTHVISLLGDLNTDAFLRTGGDDGYEGTKNGRVGHPQYFRNELIQQHRVSVFSMSSLVRRMSSQAMATTAWGFAEWARFSAE